MVSFHDDNAIFVKWFYIGHEFGRKIFSHEIISKPANNRFKYILLSILWVFELFFRIVQRLITDLKSMLTLFVVFVNISFLREVVINYKSESLVNIIFNFNLSNPTISDQARARILLELAQANPCSSKKKYSLFFA